MKKLLCLILAFAMLAQLQIITVSATGENLIVYVAENGSDTNDGSLNSPFKTVSKAAEFANANKGAESIRIILRGGVYQATDTISFKNTQTNILWSAYPGESPVITGGVELNGSDFEPSDKLPGKDGIYQIDLKKYSVDKLLDPKPVMQATFNDESLMLARWPNDDYYYPKVLDAGTYLRGYSEDKNPPSSPDYIPPEEWKNDPGIIKYDDMRFEKWANIEDAYFTGYWGVLWSTDTLKCSEIDKTAKTIKFDRATTYSVIDGICHFYVYNVLEELDTKSEYYIDSDKIMYICPPSDIKDAKIDICLTDKEFFNLENTSNMSFSGITFKANAKSAFVISGGKNILIEDCSFTSVQDKVIEMKNTYDSTVASCRFYNIGGKGIEIESGDRNTLESCGCVIENCTFEKFSQILRTYNPAIAPSGVGVRMSNNKFNDAPHSAIIFGGNDMLMEYNEFTDLLKETDDCGIIYSGRDMTTRGHQINYNYFHDVGEGSGYGRAGIYMDDAMSSMSSFGNIFANMQKAYFMGGGRQHTIANNVFYNVQNPIPFDARSSAMTHEDLLVDKDTTDTIALRFRAVPYDSEIWKKRYPDVYEMSTDKNPGYPKHNSIYNNALIYSGQPDLNALVEQYADKIESNVDINRKSSGLIIKNGERPQIESDGDIFKKIEGFEAIPTARMGTYNDYLADKLSNAAALKIGSPFAYSAGKKTFIDTENAEVMPIIKDGRTLVPVRFISETFGADVAWDDASRTVSVDLGGKKICLVLGKNTITIDGSAAQLDVPAQSINGRTYIPLRAMAEAIGKQVFWDDRGLIYISDSETPFTEDDTYIVDDIIRKLS